ncbi:DET1- and DDB1-associated protein 1-like [Dreissena polymorpha]|uniref:DET1- and DDB1-associated protein 1-like n=1 Tax=Dreissena polymorpha TaxID=45954 RepID=UPI002263F1BE|nr:DET1- and DDB1-associated protein 1-like [Dreissena polymorpha]
MYSIFQADFLKELPSYDENNFSRFNSESGLKSSVKKPSVYICTKDHPSEQVITTEKTNILLRYLHQQWDRKNCTKRDSAKANLEASEGPCPVKMARLSQEDST